MGLRQHGRLREFGKKYALCLHIAGRGVGLNSLQVRRMVVLVVPASEIPTMKKLLFVLAVATIAVSATGCDTTRSWCNQSLCYSPAPPNACDTCTTPPAYAESYLAPPSVEVMPGPVVN